MEPKAAVEPEAPESEPEDAAIDADTDEVTPA